MKRNTLLAVAVVLLFSGGCTTHADAPAQAPTPAAIPLYDGHAPGVDPATAAAEIDDGSGNGHVLRNVTAPTLTPFLPDPAKATGTAVIIAPGGAFMMLSIDQEGNDVARWLAARGVAAFVLKYRLDHTSSSQALFAIDMGARIFHLMHRSTPDLPKLPGEDAAVADGFQALRLVKKQAAKFGVDPARIGFMGFSAGAIVATHVATEYDADTRPAFVAPIYGMIALNRPIPSDAPPLFAAVASDDPLFGATATQLYTAWRKAGRPAELHVFDKGGHGFGMKQQGTSSDHWIDEFGWWLQARGLLSPAH